MSCERFREAIASHAAGADLEPSAAAHLAACESCAARLELQCRLLAEADAELHRALSVEASADFVARVTARVAPRPARRAVWRPSIAWVGLAAAATLAVAIYSRAPRPAPSVQPGGLASTGPPAPPMTTARPAPDRPAAAPVRREAARRSTPRASKPAGTRPAEEAPVIVDGSQRQAIARLQELLATGRLNEKALPAPRPDDVAVLSISPIEIPDIPVRDADAGAAGASRPDGRQ